MKDCASHPTVENAFAHTSESDKKKRKRFQQRFQDLMEEGWGNPESNSNIRRENSGNNKCAGVIDLYMHSLWLSSPIQNFKTFRGIAAGV